LCISQLISVIISFSVSSKILIFFVLKLSEGVEENDMLDYKHFIVSSQSEYQKKCTQLLGSGKTVYVEGPLNIWMASQRQEYFVLKTGRQDLITSDEIKIEPDEEREGIGFPRVKADFRIQNGRIHCKQLS